jgi:mannose/fructose-specific phosphotransferase system component IIA
MNIGIIIITHGQLAEALKNVLFSIVGDKEKVVALSVSSECGLDLLCDGLERLVNELQTEYVLVFTDLLGGTPCNIALRSCKKIKNMYIISGVNLYMLITAVNLRQQQEIGDINMYIEKIIEEGRRNIVNVNEFFNKKLNKL